jgi:hypothetical protein
MCLLLSGCTSKEKEYTSFQDKHSMDWSAEESNYLMLLAENKGGTVEDRAYNIVVALNRVWSPDYPDTIEEVVDLELPCGKMDLIISDETIEAMHMVMYDRVDNTNGSFEYKDIYLQEE